MSPQDSFQNFVVNTRKKFSDVALEYPYRPRMIVGNDARALVKPVHRAIGTFIKTAGIGIEDERPVKIRIQDPINRMM